MGLYGMFRLSGFHSLIDPTHTPRHGSEGRRQKSQHRENADQVFEAWIHNAMVPLALLSGLEP